MLRGEIHAPVHRVLELFAAVFQNGDGVGVIHLGKISGDKALQTVDSVFIHALGEELHVVRTLFQYRFEDVLEHRFRQAGNVVQVGEGHFRLQHPEFRQVAAGVGVLGAEGRAEGINLRQRTGVGLAVQLAGNGQERLFTEEVFVEIDFALIVTRQVFQIQRRHAEHFAGAFGIGGGDQRGGNPEEALFVEEAVQRLRQGVTHAGYRANQVGARTQVRYFTQILDAVALGRHRVGVRVFHPAGHFHAGRLDLKALTLTLRSHDFTGDNHRAAGGQTQHFLIVIGQRIINNGLYRIKAGTVIDGEERKASFRISAGTHPSADRDFAVNGNAALEYVGYRHNAHNNLSM